MTQTGYSTVQTVVTPDREELKPCPICKGEVRYYEYGRIGGFGFEVECPRCHLSMTDADENRLIERWNRRVRE